MDNADARQCQGCLAGDADACASLLKRHEPAIARQMWRFTRDRNTQAELVQDVLVEVYLSLHRYRPGKMPFDHWLGRIATRVGFRFWKRQSRRRQHVSLEKVDVPAATDRPPDQTAAELLHDLLGQLGVKDRLVLTLVYFEQCSMLEIAMRTGWTSAMVKMRASRARRRLKALIVKNHLMDSLLEAAHGRT